MLEVVEKDGVKIGLDDECVIVVVPSGCRISARTVEGEHFAITPMCLAGHKRARAVTLVSCDEGLPVSPREAVLPTLAVKSRLDTAFAIGQGLFAAIGITIVLLAMMAYFGHIRPVGCYLP